LGGWAGWAAPIAALLLVGIAATLYLQRVRLPRQESAAGVASLAAMRWRDFIQLVLDALIRRGYERVFEPNAIGEEGDYVLEREGQRFLLSSKHGAAYVLGSTAIAEFASSIRMRGAAGGLLVTPGQFAAEAHPVARAHRIELLDGPTLWPELHPLLTADQRDAIAAPLRRRSHRQITVVWLVVAALAALFLIVGRRESPEPLPVPSAAPAPHPATSPTAPAPSAGAAAVTTPPTDQEALERRRTDVAAAISNLPDVDRALWQTQSTLLVYLQDDSSDPLPGICPELERYEELAATRLQLQPPPGSTRPIRFVQCRPY
jgi:hypothetical protein